MTNRKPRPRHYREIIDGFSSPELLKMFLDGIALARCTTCGEIATVEPDAEDYDCHSCGAEKAITSPLRKLGLV